MRKQGQYWTASPPIKEGKGAAEESVVAAQPEESCRLRANLLEKEFQVECTSGLRDTKAESGDIHLAMNKQLPIDLNTVLGII